MQIRNDEFTVDIVNAPPLTAKSELPDAVREVLLQNEHIRNGSFSVTELLDHPRCVMLRRKYPEITTEDPHMLVPSTAGKAVHHWFASNLTDDAILTEQQVLLPVPEFGVTVSGILDMAEFMDTAETRCIVSDLKFWKTWHWIRADFTKLVWQLNLYYLGLCQSHPGIENKTLLRGLIPFSDWSRGDAERFGSKYPEKPFMVLETKPLPLDDIQRFVRERAKALLLLWNEPESEWPDAGEEDTWQTPTTVRVIKQDGTRAVKGGVFKSDEYGSPEKAVQAAEVFLRQYEAEKKAQCDIRVDKGERKRCAQYCPVADKCSAYQSYLEPQENIEEVGQTEQVNQKAA